MKVESGGWLVEVEFGFWKEDGDFACSPPLISPFSFLSLGEKIGARTG